MRTRAARESGIFQISRILVRVIFLLCSLAAVIACAGGANAPPTGEAAAVTEARSSGEPFTPIFEEDDCPFELPFNFDEEQVRCGMVIVPEDHHRPAGPAIRLAVAIFKDDGSEQDSQPDPLIVLAGGPGQKLLEQAMPVADLLAPLHPGRDLILFDQRGVGFSEPALDCPEFIVALLENLNETDANLAAKNSFEALIACRDRLMAEGHNLAAYTTWQSAADVEMIRQALGYDLINLYGGSYGSLLAQAVMRDHPQHIRSVIMDSIWPLEKSFFVEVTTVSGEAMVHMLDRCAADVECRAAYPHLEDALYEVIDRLNADPRPIKVTHPLTGDSYRAYLTGDMVFGNVRTFMYDTAAIPILPQVIYEVYEGEYELMTRLSSIKLAAFDRLSTGMELSVACTDDLTGHTLEEYFALLDTLPPPLQGSASRETIRRYGIFAVCDAWPVEEATRRPLTSDLPTLLLSGEFDPVTPPKYAPQVDAHLSHSFAYEFPGVGHSPLGSSECAQEMFRAFLDDLHHAPDDGCLADYDIDFAVPADYDVSALEPVTILEFGIRSMAPAGWRQVEPGVFTSPDFAQIFYLLKIEMLLEEFIEENDLDGPYDEREINGRVWQFYEFHPSDPGSIGIDVISMIDDHSFYDVAVVTPEQGRELVESNLLFPALEAFAEVLPGS